MLAQFESYVAQGRTFIGGGFGPGGGSSTSSAIAEWVEQDFTATRVDGPPCTTSRRRPAEPSAQRSVQAAADVASRSTLASVTRFAAPGCAAPAFATYQSPKFPSGSEAFM